MIPHDAFTFDDLMIEALDEMHQKEMEED